MRHKEIILASTSPRRRDLLERMGVEFVVMESNYEEQHDEARTTAEVAAELGLGKARAIAELYKNDIVVGGDTIVAFEGRQLGKSRSTEEARRTLMSYSGKSCNVVSAVAVIHEASSYSRVEVVETTIQFKEFDANVVNSYVVTGDWQDKAGAFAIQHPIVSQHMLRQIDGNLDTVIGLPTGKLAKILNELGVDAHSVGDKECLELTT